MAGRTANEPKDAPFFKLPRDGHSEISATGRPFADKGREVIYWYFAEVTKMKADIGVGEVEKQAAAAREDA